MDDRVFINQLPAGVHSSYFFTNIHKIRNLIHWPTVSQKRQIIGSIYPEKLIFDGFQYWTASLNEVESRYTNWIGVSAK
jgi:hypothetical protein